ncbi:MAG: hypothetical protein V4727_00615 [Verrucomicrobiota bacterium]
MKHQLFILAILASQLHGQAEPQKPAFRDAATSESLTEKYRETSTKGPAKKFKETTGEDASVKHKVGNLLENSELITFNGNTTLVPKKAIVQIPEKYKDRINAHKPGSKILSWMDFYTLNRGWISTVEVTLAQARGEVPVSPELMETLSKKGNLVVAVLKNGPISVHTPKAEAETKPGAETKELNPKKP